MTLLLVDGANILMRCAFGGDIAPVQSAPAAVAMIERAAKELGATHLVIALDYPGAPSWRKLEYDAYKANRTTDTAPWLIEGATAFGRRGWHCEVHAGFEADDIIATLANRARHHYPVAVLSNDSDLLPLTSMGVLVARPQSGGTFQSCSAPMVCEKYSVTGAWQLFDLKAMVGETGDNLPGVPGIGPKKAASLLAKFGELETIINAGSAGYNRDATRVFEHADTARLARRLVTLREDVPVPPIATNRCALHHARVA